MKDLVVRWQRLMDQGATCPRCADTGEEVRAAVALLSRALAPLGIGPRLEETELTMAEFAREPLASNRITIGGRSLEAWLGGQVGQSACCDVCGPNDCRTIEVDGAWYEAVPADLIVRAGLLAAADIVGRPTDLSSACGGTDAGTPTVIPTGARELPLASGHSGCC